ncbi:MAG: lysophospholipid acyltransferase family protein [Ardenticatenales bacterium]
MIYRVLRAYFRFALKIFYRSIEIEGLADVPAAGPVIFAPNHANGLLDPMFIALAVERPVWLTAKSTLADHPLVGWLMRASNVVALHRTQDAVMGADPRANLAALATLGMRLRDGGAIIIFPEGQSHSDPGLRPFKRGVARLAYDYVAAGNVGGLSIVPVGMWFEDKDGFRSRALIRFGPSVDVGAWRAAQPDAPAQALTAELQAAVDAAAITFTDRREALMLAYAAELAETRGRHPAPLGAAGPRLGARADLVERLRRGYRLLSAAAPAELDPLIDRVADYRRRLRRMGITPGEVYLPLDAPLAARFVVREAAVVLVGLPFALWGIVTHAVPALIVAIAARQLAKRNDERATSAVFSALVAFPPWYVAATVWFFVRWPWMLALAATVATPVCGVAALLWLGRVRAAYRRAATYVRFVRAPELQRSLADEGQGVLETLRGYEARLGEGGGGA